MNNIKNVIRKIAQSDGGETLSKRYSLRLFAVEDILKDYFPNIIKRETHSDHKKIVYTEIAKAFEVKLSDVKKAAKYAAQEKLDDLVKAI
tara:strand:- start:1429 stop:1698 length:270 start_codon:yes stop_codon:yes gene_type:complete